MNKYIFTGGSGLLGSEIKKLFVEDLFPTSAEFNVIDYTGMENYVINYMGSFVPPLHKDAIAGIVHMAAFTSPPKVEKDPVRGIDVNIIGTANIARLCYKYNLKMIYISTDYVFNGEKGDYKEYDPMFPVNKYAWSKLGGECAVRLLDTYIIIRLSFGEKEFPYPGAFVDQYTSKLRIDVAAERIKKVIDSPFLGTIHIGSERQSVYDYAIAVSPEKDIKKIYRRDIKGTNLPKDTSLCTNRFKEFIK